MPPPRSSVLRPHADQSAPAVLVRRRGLIAGAAALVVGALGAVKTAPPVAAANPPLLMGTTNTAPASTILICAAATGGVFFVNNTDPAGGVALVGNGGPGTGVGVKGTGNGNTTDENGSGVYGINTSGSAAVGVFGRTSNGYGVYGQADTDGFGVTGSATNSFGVLGTSTSGYGVAGISTSSLGVSGTSTSGTGVYGMTSASNQYGVLGATTAPNSTAIAGIANANGSSAFSGGTTNPKAYAGVFQGNVFIQGRLVVSDPSYKSGVLQHPDGSHRLVYCVESPESWIEDFGTGQLVGGHADVKLDADFAAVVHTDAYHVFLTPHDAGNKGLAVTAHRADGFVVQELHGGTSGGTFSYRIVAKPKSAVKSDRLGTFTMPSLPLPDVSKLPRPADLLTRPKKP